MLFKQGAEILFKVDFDEKYSSGYLYLLLNKLLMLSLSSSLVGVVAVVVVVVAKVVSVCLPSRKRQSSLLLVYRIPLAQGSDKVYIHNTRTTV